MIDKANFRPRSWPVPYALLACSAIFFWSISIRAVVYTVMPAVAADLGLSSSVAGLVISALLLGYTLASSSAGWLPGSVKTRVLVGMAFSLPCVVLFALAPSLLLLFVGAALTGLGIGVYLPLGLTVVVEMGGANRKALYLSIHEVAATLASFGGSAFVAAGLSVTGWRETVLAWCIVCVLALLAFSFARIGGVKRAERRRAGAIGLSRVLVLGTVAYGIGMVLIGGLISVLPLIMVRGWGLDQSYAASIVANTRLAGLLGVAAAGLLADRFGYQRILLVLQLLTVVGTAVMSVVGPGDSFLWATAVLAVGASGNIVLIPVAVTSAFLPVQRERAMAVCAGVGGLTGMVLAPAFFGVLVDAGLPAAPMILASVGAVGMIVATRALGRKKGRASG